ncbi:MAG: hypothetical protein NTW87_08225 [Planctomycetota bacterium]|nr:hypothetical protein [Planctomycetota bacterium]
MFESILKTVAGAMRGEELLRLTETIWRSDRESTFPAFERTQRQIGALYAEAGVQAEIIEIPADGKTSYGDLTMPLAWDCREAVLELVEPAERRCVLADRSQDPLATVMWCGPTPREGIEAELVRAGSAQELAILGAAHGKDAVAPRGRIVYTRENPHKLKAEALRQGVLGIVSSYGKNADFAPDARFWVNSWSDPPDEWPYRQDDHPLPGMLLTPRQGRDLEALLDKGPVRVRMRVDSSLYAGTIVMGSSTALGTPLFLIVVWYATGMLNVGPSADTKEIQTPAVVVEAPLRDGVVDLAVGRHQEEMAVVLNNTPNPDSFPAFTDALMNRLLAKHLARTVSHFPVRATPWCAIDNFMNDPVTGVPATTLHSMDRWWHCGADTMAKIDPRTLSAIGALSATYLFFLANAGAAEAQWLAAESVADWDERLAREAASWWERLSCSAGHGTLDNLPNCPTKDAVAPPASPQAGTACLRDALARLDFLHIVGRKTALAPLRLVPSAERNAVRPVLSQLAQHARRRVNLEKRRLKALAGAGIEPAAAAPLPALPADAAKSGLPADMTAPDAERIVPVRKFHGMLCYDTIPRERREGKSSPMWNATLMRALMWADGRRSLADVLRLGALDSGLKEERILDEILFLSRNGLIEWKRK